jgi:hypothetical protein
MLDLIVLEDGYKRIYLNRPIRKTPRRARARMRVYLRKLNAPAFR